MKKLLVMIAALTVAASAHAESSVFLTTDPSFLSDHLFFQFVTQEVHYRYTLDLRLAKLNLGGGAGYMPNREYQELCGEFGISKDMKQGNPTSTIGFFARYGYVINGCEYTIFSWDLLESLYILRKYGIFIEFGIEMKYYTIDDNSYENINTLNLPFSIGVRF